MGRGLVILFLLPFLADLILLFGNMVLINSFRRRRFMKKYLGRGGLRDLFGSLSSSVSDNQGKLLKYYCMSCGKEHRETACPNCGSKMRRAG